MHLIERLKQAGKGSEWWRVVDPVDGCYCISFSRDDSLNPEREAMEWLDRQRQEFPNGRHSHYEVRREIAQTRADKLMFEAANVIDRLREIDLALNSQEIHRESARDLIREKNEMLHGTATPF